MYNKLYRVWNHPNGPDGPLDIEVWGEERATELLENEREALARMGYTVETALEALDRHEEFSFHTAYIRRLTCEEEEAWGAYVDWMDREWLMEVERKRRTKDQNNISSESSDSSDG